MYFYTGVLSVLAGVNAVAAWGGPHGGSHGSPHGGFHGQNSQFPRYHAMSGHLHMHGDGPGEGIIPNNVTSGNGTFRQPIDHNNPGLGTFEQTYWWSTEFWGGPGYPVILFTPGEANASVYTSYLTANRTTGVLAQQIKAAILNVEHRYWGFSSPYAELTTDNMRYLTLDNSISDFVNLAKNARLPFDPRRTSRPSKAPWVFMGGSYSGALAAWTAATQPGTFHAYHASSAPVESIDDYWQYFYPEQQYMPQNCSKDMAAVIEHIDTVLTTGTDDEIYALKDSFGLAGVTYNDDFGAALTGPPSLWQSNQFYTTAGFYDFCDSIEGIVRGVNGSIPANTTIPGAAGVDLQTSLAGFAEWFNTTYLPGSCESYGYFEGEYNVDCFNSHNASSPIYTDISLSNTVDRQWIWMICNEPFGYWQTGAPLNYPSIVSRLVTTDYFKAQCPLYFPATNTTVVGNHAGRTEEQVNAHTQGWDFTNSTNLLWVNGDRDPWREAGVSSDFRPGGPLQSTEAAPVVIVPLGFHTSDLVTRNGVVNAGAKAAIDQAVAQLVTWVGEFKPSRD